jgi:phospholipid N-methyltransferase
MESTNGLYFSFVREYCRNLRSIGSIVPESKVCVDALLASVPFDTAGIILEFGAASGAVTREIISRKRPDTSLISFEINGAFHSHLTRTLQGLNVFHVHADMARCGRELVDKLGVEGRSVDCIVSTLPCSSLDFDDILRRSVLPVLKDDGVFIQYMHTLSLLKGFRLGPILRRHFGSVRSEFVFRNLPPALVYACRAPRTQAIS